MALQKCVGFFLNTAQANEQLVFFKHTECYKKIIKTSTLHRMHNNTSLLHLSAKDFQAK